MQRALVCGMNTTEYNVTNFINLKIASKANVNMHTDKLLWHARKTASCWKLCVSYLLYFLFYLHVYGTASNRTYQSPSIPTNDNTTIWPESTITANPMRSATAAQYDIPDTFLQDCPDTRNNVRKPIWTLYLVQQNSTIRCPTFTVTMISWISGATGTHVHNQNNRHHVVCVTIKYIPSIFVMGLNVYITKKAI